MKLKALSAETRSKLRRDIAEIRTRATPVQPSAAPKTTEDRRVSWLRRPFSHA